ncbi:hypothetical protein BJP34_05750 [Moorena producens PAL-8-15-08-1]|uniref:Uncharacterized protein n=1 Tax=Moorena producens PAL-8-15-08-1 TaxID=1458985 RepID=A0A1D8TN25_9CYAN|nr:hypothetical protein [Moorena producens]AOW99014.1 hypothetical protein BJP34_05750 [Moorena producens PAL-8-15-08-1]
MGGSPHERLPPQDRAASLNAATLSFSALFLMQSASGGNPRRSALHRFQLVIGNCEPKSGQVLYCYNFYYKFSV